MSEWALASLSPPCRFPLSSFFFAPMSLCPLISPCHFPPPPSVRLHLPLALISLPLLFPSPSQILSLSSPPSFPPLPSSPPVKLSSRGSEPRCLARMIWSYLSYWQVHPSLCVCVCVWEWETLWVLFVRTGEDVRALVLCDFLGGGGLT